VHESLTIQMCALPRAHFADDSIQMCALPRAHFADDNDLKILGILPCHFESTYSCFDAVGREVNHCFFYTEAGARRRVNFNPLDAELASPGLYAQLLSLAVQKRGKAWTTVYTAKCVSKL